MDTFDYKAQRGKIPRPSFPESGLERGEEPLRFGAVRRVEPPPFGPAALNENGSVHDVGSGGIGRPVGRRCGNVAAGRTVIDPAE